MFSAIVSQNLNHNMNKTVDKVISAQLTLSVNSLETEDRRSHRIQESFHSALFPE